MANNNWRGVTDQLVQEMIDLYNSGCAIQKVADYFSLSRSTVDYWFRKKYVELRPNRKWFCNFDFFKDIKTEKQAYWTGMFAGDGNISKNHEISIGLKTADENHLIKFREDIDGDFPIKHTFSKSKSSPGKLFPQSEAVIGSIEMERDLNRLGYFVSTKTHTHRWPTADKIPEELWPHFLRGKFDADERLNRLNHYANWDILMRKLVKHWALELLPPGMR